jgi:hypothetical protein
MSLTVRIEDVQCVSQCVDQRRSNRIGHGRSEQIHRSHLLLQLTRAELNETLFKFHQVNDVAMLCASAPGTDTLARSLS